MSTNSNNNNKIKQQQHIEKVYSTKAANVLKIYLSFMAFSLLTYLQSLFHGYFDFGLILETLSFVFTLFSLKSIKKNDYPGCKRNIIISMIPIALLIIYDIVLAIVSINPFLISDYILYPINILLFIAYGDICKATGNYQSTDYLETFYDKL